MPSSIRERLYMRILDEIYELWVVVVCLGGLLSTTNIRSKQSSEVEGLYPLAAIAFSLRSLDFITLRSLPTGKVLDLGHRPFEVDCWSYGAAVYELNKSLGRRGSGKLPTFHQQGGGGMATFKGRRRGGTFPRPL